MRFQQVAIVGTDAISASIALALKAQPEPPTIVGYDVEPVRAELARSRGAFDRTQRRLDRVGQEADLVVVAMPVAHLRDTFSTISPGLKPGCLVTDTARLKAPVMAWADELLPKSVFFVGGHVITNPARVSQTMAGLGDATSDLLRDALYCFTTPVGTSEATVGALSDLAKAVGAQPFFIDATEHDGMQAGVEGLPSLLTVALLLATVDTPGWQEMRKFAGPPFDAATAAVEAAYADWPVVYHNRANVLLRLNGLLSELIGLREILSRDDVEALEATFARAVQARSKWVQERDRGLWGGETATPMVNVPTSGEHMGTMIFGDKMARRLKRGRNPSPRA